MFLLFNLNSLSKPPWRDVLYAGAVVVWTLTNQMVLPSFDNEQRWPFAGLHSMGVKVQIVACASARVLLLSQVRRRPTLRSPW